MRYPPSALPIIITLIAALLLGLYLFPGIAPRRSRPPVILPLGLAPGGGRFAPLVPAAPPVPDTTRLLTAQQREVAPGLVVLERGTPVSDDPAAVPQRILTIVQDGHVVYADTAADFLYPPDTADAGYRLYPLWVPTGRSQGELLVRVASPPDFDFVRRFLVAGHHIICRDTLPTFDGPARNLDRDAAPEYDGFRQSGEVWTDGQGYFWQAYNPRLYYERRPTGLVLDSALTRRRALARYGVFRGFRYSDKPGIRIKHL